MLQNEVVSPTLNTNEASLGIATVGIAFQPDPSIYYDKVEPLRLPFLLATVAVKVVNWSEL